MLLKDHKKKDILRRTLLLYMSWLRGLILRELRASKAAAIPLNDIQKVMNTWILVQLLPYVTTDNKHASDIICNIYLRHILATHQPNVRHVVELASWLHKQLPSCNAQTVIDVANEYIETPEMFTTLTNNATFDRVFDLLDTDELDEFARQTFVGEKAEHDGLRSVSITNVLLGVEQLPTPGFCLLFRSIAAASCHKKSLEERLKDVYFYSPTISVLR